MTIVLAFSGKIASGKSDLSRAVAAELRWPRASFGGYVGKLAVERGLDAKSRQVLQALGEDQVRNNIGDFCAGLLQAYDWRKGESLVIDGLRHVEVAERLRALVEPCELITIHLDTDKSTRVNRLAKRPSESNADFVHIDSFDAHSTERQAEGALPEFADLVLDGTLEIPALQKQVVELVQEVLRFPGRSVEDILGPRVTLSVWFPDFSMADVKLERGKTVSLNVELHARRRGSRVVEKLSPEVGSAMGALESVDVWIQCPEARVEPVDGILSLPLPSNVLSFKLTPQVAGTIKLTVVLLARNEPIHRLERELNVSAGDADYLPGSTK